MPSDERIARVMGALLRAEPRLRVRQVVSPYNRNSTMLSITGSDYKSYDLFRNAGVWKVWSGDPEEGAVPIAVKQASPEQVAEAYLKNFGGSGLLADERLPRARPPGARLALVPGLLAALLLLLAALPLDYAFYPVLRIAVTAASVWLAVVAHSLSARGWMVFAIAMAVLFNPLFPVYSTRALWVPVDVIAAVAFATAAFTLRGARHR